MLGDSEPERLGRPNIDDELELGRLLNWKIGRLRPLEYLVHVGGSSAEWRGVAGGKAHQPALVHEAPVWVHGWKAISRRHLRDQVGIREQQCCRRDDQGLGSLAYQVHDGSLDVAGALDGGGPDLK